MYQDRLSEMCPVGEIDGIVVVQTLSEISCHVIKTLIDARPFTQRQLEAWRALANSTFCLAGECACVEIERVKMLARLSVRTPLVEDVRKLDARIECFMRTLIDAGILENPIISELH